jgi:hypothetical protein
MDSKIGVGNKQIQAFNFLQVLERHCSTGSTNISSLIDQENTMAIFPEQTFIGICRV